MTSNSNGPVACSEAARSSAIDEHGLVEWCGEGRFDSIVAYLSRLCEAPVSLVSLVESDRQRFLAKVGIDAEETPRSVSFCAHAMRGTAIMVVPDATQDRRFQDNPLVTGAPHIRFYAGAPLVTREGVPLGALCVIDDKPRPGLSALQEEALYVMASAVMAIIDARRESEQRLLVTRELSHRIKNLFTLVGGLIHFSADSHGNVPREDLSRRVTALGHAHALIHHDGLTQDDVEGIDATELIETLVAPYRYADGGRLHIDAPALMLPGSMVTPFALIFHEFATNAAKYGALSSADGTVSVDITDKDGHIEILWRERGGPALDPKLDRSEGFGTTLIERTVVRQLRASLDRDWQPEGLTIRLRLPSPAIAIAA
ncbi:hypothetical protein GCM10023219_11530 [Stakelama sediminis]|uniref:histidine kinase n=1 Tax=Stakelama sediminis TaxID=463200 RepID=A0A840YWE7_9SPHN|nr:GAF domain-containing protein [Stakelama sediminis]MBB5717877.1 two-component sensor histidine kinase [Stakelama sediminis]